MLGEKPLVRSNPDFMIQIKIGEDLIKRRLGVRSKK